MNAGRVLEHVAQVLAQVELMEKRLQQVTDERNILVDKLTTANGEIARLKAKPPIQ